MTKSALGILVLFTLIIKITTIASKDVLGGAPWQLADRYRSETFVLLFILTNLIKVSFLIFEKNNADLAYFIVFLKRIPEKIR